MNLDKINNKFLMPGDHTGFEDIMLAHNEPYPEDCFNPHEYFHLDGAFRFHFGPVLPVPPIQRLIELDEEERIKAEKREAKLQRIRGRKAQQNKEAA